MGRLTEISASGNAYYPKCFEEPCCGGGECQDDNCKLMYDVCKKLSEYEEIGTPEELKELKEHGAFTGVELAQIAEMQKELKKYKAAEEQGLLVRLPCKVGDIVYRIVAVANHSVIPMNVLEIHFLCYNNERAVMFSTIGDMGESCYRSEDIGEIVFLTREGAEKKLREMNE